MAASVPLGIVSGWLSSRAFTAKNMYWEPVAIFLTFATVLLIPEFWKGKLLPWIRVCLVSFGIYFLVLNAWFLPAATMTIGSILFLTSFFLFFRIKRQALVVTLTMSMLQFLAGILIMALLEDFLPRDLDASSSIATFTRLGFPVFVWQILAMVSIAWFLNLRRDEEGKFL